MIEGEAPDNTWPLLAEAGAAAPTEEVVAEGLEAAKRAIGELIDFQHEFLDAVGVSRAAVGAAPAVRRGRLRRRSPASRRTGSPSAIVPDKAEREASARRAEGRDEGAPAAQTGRGRVRRAHAASSVAGVEAAPEEGHAQARDRRGRPARRPPARPSIRPLSAEVGVLPRAHGSALFSRGDTQVLNVTTLGMLRMTQMIDTLDLEDSKRYMHHYNFPPFSTGETGRVGSPRRREIGHGALAERALDAGDPERGGVPLRAAARVRRAVVERLHVDGAASAARRCR